MDLDNMKTEWSNMRRGIDAQAALLADAPALLYERAAAALGDAPPSRIYLTGCGDSHYSGLAARYAIEFWSGVATEALESLEFSRYAVQAAPVDALLVGVSNSGKVSRSVESVRFARQRGLDTLAVTYKPDSRLAAAADQVLQYDYEDIGFGPGTLSYTASTLALLALGIRLGETTDRLSASDVKRAVAGLSAPLLSDGSNDRGLRGPGPRTRGVVRPRRTLVLPWCRSQPRHRTLRDGQDDRIVAPQQRRAGTRGMGPRAVLLLRAGHHDRGLRAARRVPRPRAGTASCHP